MSESKVLFSASGKTGEYYKDVVKAEEIQPEEWDISPYMDYKIQLYLKVGLYCNWSWQEFCETPYPVIKYISDEMDFRLEHHDTNIFNWQMLAFLLAIRRAFGGKEQN